jgi:hypothetical protein
VRVCVRVCVSASACVCVCVGVRVHVRARTCYATCACVRVQHVFALRVRAHLLLESQLPRACELPSQQRPIL